MALVERWIDPNAAPGGDGSSGNPYSSWNEWDTAEETDLITDGDSHTVYLRSGVSVESVDLTWVADDTNKLTAKSDAGHDHNGVRRAGHVLRWTAGQRTLRSSVKAFEIEGFSIENLYTGNGGFAFDNVSTSYPTTAKRMFFEGADGSTAATVLVAARPTVLESCCIVRGQQQGITVNSFQDLFMYNCTIAHSRVNGLAFSSRDLTAYNTVVHGNPSGRDWPTGAAGETGDFNGAGDGTALGANSVQAVVDGDFLDYANSDLNIASESSQLYDSGTATGRPAFDIAGNPWSTNDIGAFAFLSSGPGEPMEVTLGNAASVDTSTPAPTVEVPTTQTVTLGNAASVNVSTPAPTIDAPTTQTVTLGNAASVNVSTPAPTVEALQAYNVILANAAHVNVSTPNPTIESPQQEIVTLANAARVNTSTPDPTIQSGGLQIVNLANAARVDTSTPAPTVQGTTRQEVTLGNAASVNTSTPAPTVEGESDLPPVIQVPTEDQVLAFGRSGTIPAPPFDPGTGSNITWSLLVDEFSAQPGVTTFTINPTTGDISYTIAQLSTDANEQALNTKGPYNITRRVTTSVAHADESWQIGVNVGNLTLDFTPGRKLVTWETATPLARGLQTDKDLSAPVTQTYTVT